MATSTTKTKGPVYVLKGKAFRSVRIAVAPRILRRVPWVIRLDTTVGHALQLVRQVPLQTLFIIDDDGNLLGVATTSPDAAKGCDGGGGGGGDLPGTTSSSSECQSKCDAACADRGGCAFIIWDPFAGATGKCRYECNGEATNFKDETVGGAWF